MRLLRATMEVDRNRAVYGEELSLCSARSWLDRHDRIEVITKWKNFCIAKDDLPSQLAKPAFRDYRCSFFFSICSYSIVSEARSPETIGKHRVPCKDEISGRECYLSAPNFGKRLGCTIQGSSLY